MKELKFYTIEDAFKYRTIQLPKELFVSNLYKGLSITAKVIYGFIVDRAFLSIKNGWVENGHPYIYYTRKSFENLLGLSNKTIINAFKELNNYELIYEVKQGMTKPNKIFPIQYKHDVELDEYICKKYTSRSVNTTSSDVNKLQTNNTYNNNINITNNRKNNFCNYEQRNYTTEQLEMLYENYNSMVEENKN